MTTNKQIIDAIERIIDAYLEEPEEGAYRPLKDALKGALIEIHNKELAVALAKAGAGAGEKRPINDYVKWVSAITHLKPSKRDKNPELSNYMITVLEQPKFKDPNSNGAKAYINEPEAFLHNGKPIAGQTLNLVQLYDAVTAKVSNAMSRASLMWSLLNDTTHKEIIRLIE